MPASMSTSMDHQERPLLTPDEISRLKAPAKQGEGLDERIVTAGDELVFVAGHRPIHATQLLYFGNPVLLERSKLAPPGEAIAIVNGSVIAQPPMSRTPRVISAPEVVVPAAPVAATPAKAGKKKAKKEEEQLPLLPKEESADEANAYPV